LSTFHLCNLFLNMDFYIKIKLWQRIGDTSPPANAFANSLASHTPWHCAMQFFMPHGCWILHFSPVALPFALHQSKSIDKSKIKTLRIWLKIAYCSKKIQRKCFIYPRSIKKSERRARKMTFWFLILFNLKLAAQCCMIWASVCVYISIRVGEFF